MDLNIRQAIFDVKALSEFDNHIPHMNVADTQDDDDLTPGVVFVPDGHNITGENTWLHEFAALNISRFLLLVMSV
ncbi:MAG: hypothetical protein HQK55_13920 [Deltaproteobacteria bacterium]|nr:hypothetical protein [Deltaproteobacteria bacterium]